MKKTLSLVLVLFMLVSFSACNSSENTDTEANNNKEKIENKEETKDEKIKDEEKEKTGKNKSKNEISGAKVLKNIHARRAIAMGFDKTYICESILSVGSSPVDFFVPAGFAYNENGEDFRDKYPDGFLTYNPEEAKKEWELAKKELGFDKTEIELLAFNTDNSKETIPSKIKSDLMANLDGLKVKINQQTYEQKNEAALSGKFMIDMAGWSPDYADPLTFLDLFSKNSGHNVSKYNNKKYEDLLKKAKENTDFIERWGILQEAEKLLLEDAVVVPIAQTGDVYLKRPYIKNLERQNFGANFYYKNTTTDKEAEGERIINLLGGAPEIALDINKVIDQNSLEILSNLNEGLVVCGKDDDITGGVAREWEVSEDKLTYTFYLRDCKWSNGDAIIAQDFVDSWQRLGNPETKSQYAILLETAGIKNAEDVINGKLEAKELGVEALDNYTLQVSLDRPVPYFLQLMSFPSFFPINKKFVDEAGEDYGTSIDTLLFNGPYKMISWDLGYGLEFKKNENYWDVENVQNDGIKYREAKDMDTAVAMYDNHEIDVCPISNEYTEQRKESPDFFVEKGYSIFYLIINTNVNMN